METFLPWRFFLLLFFFFRFWFFVLGLFIKKKKKSGADDLLLIFAFIICKADKMPLHAEIKFMSDYITEHQSQMMCGYYLS